MANSPSGESVITRVVRILEAFTDQSAPLSIREVAARTSLPVSTTHRLLGELEAEGLLVKGEDGTWRHGTRLWEISSKGSPAQTLREAALPPMEDVVAGLGVHVSLGILDRHEVLYIERLTPHDFTVNITEIAGRLPAHATSTGLALTAFGPPENQEVMLRRQLTSFTTTTTTDPDDLRKLFAQIYREGFIAMPGAIIPESTGISVPVLNSAHLAIAALTIIVPVGSENLEVTVPQLKFAARAIRRRLGFTPESLPGFFRQAQSDPRES